MTRPRRTEYPNAIHHVTQRGNGRQTIFETPRDYAVFLATLGGVVERHTWQVLSYCLMPNHVHLLIRTPDPTLSKGMRMLTGTYARRFNAANDVTGHVFQGRYWSQPIETDEQYESVLRYIALNPVTSGLVVHAAEWRWSAHAQLAGIRDAAPILASDEALRLLSPSRSHARRRYVKLVGEAEPAALASDIG
jgi:putative transposase